MSERDLDADQKMCDDAKNGLWTIGDAFTVYNILPWYISEVRRLRAKNEASEKAVMDIARWYDELRERTDAEIDRLKSFLPSHYCSYCGEDTELSRLNHCDTCGCRDLCSVCIFRENHSCDGVDS